MCSHIVGKSEETPYRPTPIDPEKVAELQASAPSEELIAVVAATFQALGDPTRLKILYTLSKNFCCVRDLAILVGVSESAVSHQLRLLKNRRLVTQRREGTTMYYSLHNSHLAVLFREAEYHADHVYQDFPDHSYLWDCRICWASRVQAMRAITQNLIFALGVLTIAVGLAIPDILSPVTGTLLHELSSIPVIAKSARLIGLRDRDK